MKCLVTSLVATKRSSEGVGNPPTASHLTALARPSTSFNTDGDKNDDDGDEVMLT